MKTIMMMSVWLLNHPFARVVLIAGAGIAIAIAMSRIGAAFPLPAALLVLYIAVVGAFELFISSESVLTLDFELKIRSAKTPQDFYLLSYLMVRQRSHHWELFESASFMARFRLDYKIRFEEVFEFFDDSDESHAACLTLYCAASTRASQYGLRVEGSGATQTEKNAAEFLNELVVYAEKNVRRRKKFLSKKYGHSSLEEYCSSPLPAYQECLGK